MRPIPCSLLLQPNVADLTALLFQVRNKSLLFAKEVFSSDFSLRKEI
jgi:hypothetical protein